MEASLYAAGYATYKQARQFARLAGKSTMAKDLKSSGDKDIYVCKKIIGFYDAVTKAALNARI